MLFPLTMLLAGGSLFPSPAHGASADVTTLAGGLGSGPATAVGQLPVTVVARGPNLYVADTANNVVRSIDLAGGLEMIVAGGGIDGLGDGGPATSARLSAPSGIAFDSAGNLFIADAGNHRIRVVTTAGTISTFAGNGVAGFSGDTGAATAAMLNDPAAVVVDPSGWVLIADSGNNRIRRVDSGIVTTVAGTGIPGFSGDGGQATAAALNSPRGLAVDTSGNVYIGDSWNNRVRKVTGAGTIATVAGTGVAGFSGEGGDATSAALNSPRGLAVDGTGALLIADLFNHRIRRVESGVITSVVGTGVPGFSGDGGIPTGAALNFPTGVAVSPAGTIYVADNGNYRVRSVSGGVIATIAGTGWPSFGGDGGLALAAQFDFVRDVAPDGSGGVYVADRNNNRVRRVDAGGLSSTIAGNGDATFSGDGGAAAAASLRSPSGVAVGPDGSVYVADTGNHRVRKISGGVITTVAGTGIAGSSGDGGIATSASLRSPEDVIVGPSGALYIADTGNRKIRRIAGGVISTVAGVGTTGSAGDGGPATSAQLATPSGIAFDSAGVLFIADTGNHRVRKVADGIISTVAGTGVAAFGGDGGAPTSAQLNFPVGVAVDATGKLFIADTGNHRIRVAESGTISTLAGTGLPGFGGDGGPGSAARLNFPRGLGLGPTGPLLVADSMNGRVRAVSVSSPSADLATEVRSALPHLYVGDGATAIFTISNAGPNGATGVVAAVSLPGSLDVVSAGASQGTCAPAGAAFECALGSIAAGGNLTLNIEVSASGPGPSSVVVSVDGDQPDPAPANDAASSSTTIDPSSDVRITSMAAVPDPVVAGRTLAIQVSILNAGPSPVTGATVVHQLQSGVGFAGPPGGACSDSAGTVTCSVGSLDVGQAAAVSIDVTPTVVDSFLAAASVSADGHDPNSTNNAAYTSFAVVPVPVTIEVAHRQINTRSRAAIAVVLRSAPDFDAGAVDVATLCFGDADSPAQRDCSEADGVGQPLEGGDVRLQFETHETGIDPGDTMACLTGTTPSGLPFAGCGPITAR